MLVRSILCALAAAAVLHGGVLAQNAVLRGRVLAAGAPVPGQPIALHHVADTGGSTLGTDTTDAQGRFEIALATLPSVGVLFAATRYQDQLYVGEPFRGNELPGDYVLLVGPGATPIDFSGIQANPAGAVQRTDNRTAGLIVVLVAALALGGGAFLLWRRSLPPRRRLLVEIAELDERHTAKPVRDYELKRRALIERLRETV